MELIALEMMASGCICFSLTLLLLLLLLLALQQQQPASLTPARRQGGRIETGPGATSSHDCSRRNIKTGAICFWVGLGLALPRSALILNGR